MLNTISNLFTFVGGLGMFLYGMNIMADGMQKTAGSKMKDFLNMLTNNRLMGVGLGAMITAIIQSSGATTVMVVGFVSAGLMTLNQAVGVIMGANIGTTITAWIVSLSQLGDSLKVLNPEFYAPVLIGIGAALTMFAKSARKKTAAEIMIGIGLLFMGLKFMSDAIAPYTESPVFGRVFTTLGGNPILGMLAGAVITAIIQSSSVSVGILQTLALSGLVTTNAAIFITLGENIGSCVTALLSAVGGSRKARRAAVIHLSFNIIGAILGGTVGFLIFTMNPAIAAHRITPVEISIFHTLFKTTMTFILLPFADKLVTLSGIIVKEKPETVSTEAEQGEDLEMANTLKHLDPRIFETPPLAVDTVAREVVHMGELACANVDKAIDAIMTGSTKDIEEVKHTEATINNMEKILTDYLIKVDNLSLSEHQKLVVTDLFNSITDIERVGDHAENIAENVKYLDDRKLGFSEVAVEDMKDITANVRNGFFNAVEARRTGSLDCVRKVNQFEDQVDSLRDELREKHIERLSSGKCVPAAGIIFIDIISNLERISDHAVNLAGYIKKEI
jgi:phosphate:Na+ symporter